MSIQLRLVRRGVRRLGAVALVMVTAWSLIGLAPSPARAATPSLAATLSIKPSRIEPGGTFTLTATLTPSAPIAGLRVAIYAENWQSVYGEFHGCTPGCTPAGDGHPEWEWATLDAKTTIKVLWTDNSNGDSSRNHFYFGASGDVNLVNPPDVYGYIGGAAPTATPRATPRITPKPSLKPTTAPVATARPSASAPAEPSTDPVGSVPATASPIGSPPPTIAPMTSAPASATGSGAASPPSAAPVGEVAASIPPAVPILAVVVILGLGFFALRSLRKTGPSP